MKRIIKKIIKIILILMLIVSLMTACTYKAYAASAAGVVVAGGSIGTGGAAVGLLGLMGPITAILGVALASYGIYAVLDSSAEEEGKTKTEFIYEKVTEYNEQRNMSDAAMQDLILEGATVLKNGAISISHSASAYINGFINYLFGSDAIANPDLVSGVASTTTFGGVEMPVFSPGMDIPLGVYQDYQFLDSYNTNRYYAAFRCSDMGRSMYIFFLSNIGGTVYFKYAGASGVATMTQFREGVYYYTIVDNSYESLPASEQIIPDLSGSYRYGIQFLQGTSGSVAFSAAELPTSLYGDESIYNDRSGTLSPSADENTVFTPPLVGGLSGSGVISVPDYLDAVNSILNTGAADIPISDPVTDVVTSVAVTDIDLTETVPSVDTAEEQDEIGTTAVVDPDAPLDPDVDTINSLAFDLREIFPFCIPFDLYNLISKFVAEPEAPHWQISIPLPLNLPALEFEIDLSGFESAAVVLRSFEMVVFVASLAVATRSIYLRG